MPLSIAVTPCPDAYFFFFGTTLWWWCVCVFVCVRVRVLVRVLISGEGVARVL